MGLASGQRRDSHRVVAAKSCDADTRVAPTIGGSVPSMPAIIARRNTRNPANDTEKTTKLTNRR